MPSTYEPIATQTLGSATATITLNSIPSTYTDLRVVLVCSAATGSVFPKATYNNNTSSIYSSTFLNGSGTSASSNLVGGYAYIQMANNGAGSNPVIYTLDIFSYAGSTFKTTLVTTSEDANGSGAVARSVNLFQSTSAITRVDLYTGGNNFAIGTTATLYGIKNF